MQREQVRTFLIGVEFKSARLCQERPAQAGADDETGRTAGAWRRADILPPNRRDAPAIKFASFATRSAARRTFRPS